MTTIGNGHQHLLLPIDDSPPSKRAVEFVAREAPGAEVTLFHVAALPPELIEHPGAEDPVEETLLERKKAAQARGYQRAIEREGYDDLFAPAEERLARSGLTVHRKVVTQVHPRPAQAIIDVVRDGAFDAVVLAHQDRGKISEWLFSSVAEDVTDALGTERVTVVD